MCTPCDVCVCIWKKFAKEPTSSSDIDLVTGHRKPGLLFASKFSDLLLCEPRDDVAA